MDAIFFVYPVGVAYIVDAVCAHYQGLLRRDSRLWSPGERRAHAAVTLRETVEAVNCLNLEVADEQTILEIVEARDAFDLALVNLRAGPDLEMAGRGEDVRPDGRMELRTI